MKKEENDWHIEFEESDSQDPKLWGLQRCLVHINGTEYWMKEDLAAVTHAILLLVDAVNDKKIK